MSKVICPECGKSNELTKVCLHDYGKYSVYYDLRIDGVEARVQTAFISNYTFGWTPLLVIRPAPRLTEERIDRLLLLK